MGTHFGFVRISGVTVNLVKFDCLTGIVSIDTIDKFFMVVMTGKYDLAGLSCKDRCLKKRL